MKVVIIGSGNVATVLGRLIKSAGHHIIEVASKNMHYAQVLADELKCKANDDFNAVTKEADLYILAISDNSIKTVAAALHLDQGIIVHTSGSVSKEVLQKASHNYGVLYPLQSLRKEAVHIPPIPLLVDGNNDAVIKLLQAFAETISNKVTVANDEVRLKLHVAAVVVSNFTNHLYTLTSDYCKKEHIDFSALSPLIEEVADRVKEYNPENMQTGPAIRGDSGTIEKHIQLLADYPQLQKIYAEITESIQKFHANK